MADETPAVDLPPIIKEVRIPIEEYRKDGEIIHSPKYRPQGYFPNSWCLSPDWLIVSYQNEAQTAANQAAEAEAAKATTKAAKAAAPVAKKSSSGTKSGGGKKGKR